MKYYLEAFDKYATFKGRTSRRQFWYFMLFHFIFFYGLSAIDDVLELYEVELSEHLLSFLYSLLTILPYVAITVRRLHDTGYTGWFIFVPIFNFILLFIEGKKGANQYGSPPEPVEFPFPPSEY